MKTEVILAMMLGAVAGAIVVSYYKPAREAVKCGAEKVIDTTEELIGSKNRSKKRGD